MRITTKKIKRFLKNMKRAVYKRQKIEKLLEESIKFLSQEEYEKSYLNDKKIIEIVSSLNGDDRKINNEILDLMKVYIYTVGRIARYQQDSYLDNKTIASFSKAILEGKFNQRNFDNYVWQNFIIEIVVANINIHKLITYDKIYKKNKNSMDDFKKIELFNRILLCYCGELSLEDEVLPVINNFKNQIAVFESKISNAKERKAENEIRIHNAHKYQYIRAIYKLLDKLKYNIKEFDEFIKKEITINLGKDTLEIATTISFLSNDKKYSKEISSWKNSLIGKENLSFTSDTLSFIEKNVEVANSREKIERKPFLEEKEESEYDLKQLSIDTLNKKITREKINNRALEQEEIYKNKINSKDQIKDKFICLDMQYTSKTYIRYTRFWSEFDTNLKKIKKESNKDTVYFFINDYSLVNGTLSLPILLEAKKRGYPCVPTSPRTFQFIEGKDQWLNNMAGTMNSDIDLRYEKSKNLRKNWKIDIEKKEIISDGLNIYQPIFEFVSRYQFSYFFNYHTDAWARVRTHLLIETFDRLFDYCEEIERWAVQNKKKVKFISNAPHLHNAAAFRIYCEEKGYKNNMNFIVLSPGYDNYFKNVGDAQTETLAALNLTQNLYSRNAFLGTKEGFESYYENNINRLEEVKVKVDGWLNYQRSHKAEGRNSKKQDEILERIIEHKKQGKKVYLLNGKVIFDLGVKYTKGCAHKDMSDWITHTVETINKNKDVLLLIKPHPHETRIDLTMTSEPKVILRDLVKVPMEDNIIYLDNDAFRIIDLVKYIDLGILWNGTSALEFAAQGIKTVVADIWGHYDYPIGFLEFHSMEEYEDVLNNPDNFNGRKDLVDRAILFLEYMGSDKVRIINKYTKTSSFNFFQFTNSKIFSQKIDKYLEEGDSELENLFDEINN